MLFRSDATSVILVLYDENWTVISAAGDYNVHGQWPSEIDINLNGYTLIAPLERADSFILLAPPVYSEQEVIPVPSEDKCHLFINLPEDPIAHPGHVFMRWVYLDDESILDLYGFWGSNYFYLKTEITSQNLFVRNEATKGLHAIELSSANSISVGSIVGKVETYFQCYDNKNIIVTIDAKVSHPKMQTKNFLEGEIRISDSWTETSNGRRQVLLHQGK